MKKKALLILSTLAFISLTTAFVGGAINTDRKILIDIKVDLIHEKLESYPTVRQQEIYRYLIKGLNKGINDDNSELFTYIINRLEPGLKKGEVVLEIEEIIESITIAAHNSLILRFTRGGNTSGLIEGKKENIKNLQSVFIFRSGKTDLSRADIKNITSKILAVNPNILLFVDQEGGYVNRYVDFESSTDVQKYFDEDFVSSRYIQLTQLEKNIIRGLFPQNYGYFPSMGSVGVQYDNFSTAASKKLFLEIIAHIRLKSLKDNGINTYGLVADLNYGNPAISSASRSFSKHAWKYKELIDAYNLASSETGISLYLKHFPGHGAGLVDSHVGILNLQNNSEYLKENMDVFRYFLDTKTTNGGLMIGHIVFDSSLKASFDSIIEKADYILTDDLAMQGYIKMIGSTPSGVTFSTSEIISNPHVIKVDTQYVESVY